MQVAFLGLTDLQERAYVVHHGDKGKICDEINSARWNDPVALLISSYINPPQGGWHRLD